jgi:cation diffusion facilitator CzcD-associated flavoprotein CzcO
VEAHQIPVSDPHAVHDTVIVGAGFGGLCAGIKLREAGFTDFVILEKAHEVGGTWRENTYPGAGCDVMSLMYSLSFAPNTRWTRIYANQAEILDYLRRTATAHGLDDHLRFGREVTSTVFDDATHTWTLGTQNGETYRARVVIAAPGPLHVPSTPDFPGRNEFAGVSFHSAEWDHDFDPTGKRIAVIGTGASATQFIPQLAKSAASLTVFQRTPHWIIPKLDRPITPAEHWLFRHLPGAQKAYRYGIYWAHEAAIVGFMNPRYMPVLQAVAQRHLRSQVRDPRLRARLTPDYTVGCKRIIVSSDYYPTLQRPNVELVTSAVDTFTTSGIRTVDGSQHDVDAIIYGTGFKVTERMSDETLVGAGGLTIQEAWRDGMEAYLGVTVHGFPNYFLIMGPNSGGGHQSIVFVIEAQVRYIVECLRLMVRTGSSRIEVRNSTQRLFNRKVHAKLEGSVWNSGGCNSWYLDAGGKNRAAWPGSSVSYWRRMRTPVASAFDLVSGTGVEDVVYDGPATLALADGDHEVQVRLTGHLEPLDGRYHWQGMAFGTLPDDVLNNSPAATLTVEDQSAAARITERTPWGSYAIAGVGQPPFALGDIELAVPQP